MDGCMRARTRTPIESSDAASLSPRQHPCTHPGPLSHQPQSLFPRLGGGRREGLGCQVIYWWKLLPSSRAALVPASPSAAGHSSVAARHRIGLLSPSRNLACPGLWPSRNLLRAPLSHTNSAGVFSVFFRLFSLLLLRAHCVVDLFRANAAAFPLGFSALSAYPPAYCLRNRGCKTYPRLVLHIAAMGKLEKEKEESYAGLGGWLLLADYPGSE